MESFRVRAFIARTQTWCWSIRRSSHRVRPAPGGRNGRWSGDRFEAKTCVDGGVKNLRGGLSTQSALALAKLCYRTLLADGADALRAVEQVVTPALERLVEANTLLSGVGFESSGLAAAHAVHNGLTTAPATHAYLHGEKVAFGLMTQLVLEGKPLRGDGSSVEFRDRGRAAGHAGRNRPERVGE